MTAIRKNKLQPIQEKVLNKLCSLLDEKELCENIEKGLARDDYKRGKQYEIMLVPNITNITYGRGVGYVFEEEVFEDSINKISATKIREEMRE